MRRELALTFLWGTSRNLCSGTRHTTLRTFKTINILDKTFRNPSAFNPSRSAHVHPATFQIPSESSRTETLLKLSKVRCEKSSKHLHHCKKMQKAPKPSKLPQSPKVVQNPPRGWRSNTSEICLVSPEPLPPPGVCPFAHLPTSEVFSLEVSAALPPIIRISGPYEVSETCSFTLDPCSQNYTQKSVLWEVCILLHSFSL